MATIRFIGDVHGKVDRYKEIVQGGANDITIQVGDFHVEYGDEVSWCSKADLPKTGMDNYIIPGNHDDWEWILKHAKDPITDAPFFYSGTLDYFSSNLHICWVAGAASVDKNHNPDWNPNEEMGMAQALQIADCYKNEWENIDVIVSHDCPYQILFDMYHSSQVEKTKTNELLQHMFDTKAPKLWVFGHHHQRFVRIIGDTTFVGLGECDYFDYTFPS